MTKKKFDDTSDHMHVELASIKQRLAILREMVGIHSSHAKRIDEASARIKTIEEHLGIKTGA